MSFDRVNYHQRGLFSIPLLHSLGLNPPDLSNPKTWQLDEHSKQLFKNARDGQGFSIIANIDTQTVYLLPAFNGNDGLVREDKNGKTYDANDFVDSQNGGVGVIHKQSIRKIFGTNQKAAERAGFTLGGGLTKGAESHNEKDYHIRVLTSEQSIQIKAAFADKVTDSLPGYDPKTRYIVLCETKNADVYEIYYIQNQRLVRDGYAYKSRSIPTIELNSVYSAEMNAVLAEACLKKLSLWDNLTVKNKSASQNNASISYDYSFECYVMYLDEEKYNLRSNGFYRPEGVDEGSLYDLQRSIPPALMQPLYLSLVEQLELTPDLDKQVQHWSSWNTPEYNQLIAEYSSSSTDTKLKRYQNNIDITLNLYVETLLLYIKIEKEIGEEQNQGYLLTRQGMVFYAEKYPQFKKMFLSSGRASIAHFDLYLNLLRDRLTKLISLYVNFGNENTLWNALSNKVSMCRKRMEGVENYDIQLRFNRLTEIVEKKAFLSDRDDKLEKVQACLLHLCTTNDKALALQQFSATGKGLYNLIKQIYIEQGQIEKQVKQILNTKIQNKTALQNALQQDWYDVASLLVAYGAELDDLTLRILKTKTINKSSHSEQLNKFIVLVSNQHGINFAERIELVQPLDDVDFQLLSQQPIVMKAHAHVSSRDLFFEKSPKNDEKNALTEKLLPLQDSGEYQEDNSGNVCCCKIM